MPWYTHIKVLPILRSMRKEGKLRHDQNTVIETKESGYQCYRYLGDIDDKSEKATGWGCYITKRNFYNVGTFLDEKEEGVLIVTHMTYGAKVIISAEGAKMPEHTGYPAKWIYQYYNGQKHGYATHYERWKITNYLYKDDEHVKEKKVTPHEAFFSHAGKPLKLLHPNHSDYI